jgi:hypothetical protein
MSIVCRFSVRELISTFARAGTRARGSTDLTREVGMATAEYAVVTLAACGFAGLLVALLRSDTVRELLLGIIRRALSQ